MAARKPTFLAQFEQATSGDPRAPVVLTDEDRRVFEACVSGDGRGSSSPPMQAKYLKLFRRVLVVSEVWANGTTHLNCKALIDTSQLPAVWAGNRTTDRPASVLIGLHLLWSDLLKGHGLKLQVSGSAGAATGGSFGTASLSKCKRLVERHQQFIADSPLFLGPVADEWLLPTVQGLLDLGDAQGVISFAPRLVAALGHGVLWEGLAGLRILCDAYAKAGQLEAGNASTALPPEALDALKPELLPPFADGRNEWYRAMPVRAWGQAMASLARLRLRAGDEGGAREAARRAWLAAATPDERRSLRADAELRDLVEA